MAEPTINDFLDIVRPDLNDRVDRLRRDIQRIVSEETARGISGNLVVRVLDRSDEEFDAGVKAAFRSLKRVSEMTTLDPAELRQSTGLLLMNFVHGVKSIIEPERLKRTAAPEVVDERLQNLDRRLQSMTRQYDVGLLDLGDLDTQPPRFGYNQPSSDHISRDTPLALRVGTDANAGTAPKDIPFVSGGDFDAGAAAATAAQRSRSAVADISTGVTEPLPPVPSNATPPGPFQVIELSGRIGAQLSGTGAMTAEASVLAPTPVSIARSLAERPADIRDIGTAASDGKTLVPEIPKQGYGPHFEIGDDGIITFAPPAKLDRLGNNIDRLNKLHPTLQELSRALVEALGKGNVPHGHLLARAQTYDALINKTIESIDFSLLYIAGLRLANAEKASSGDKELPSLDASVRETIDSLLQLHGAFMLATVEGAEAIAAEERYQRNPQEENEYRSAAVNFAKSLQDQPEVVDPRAASTILSAVEEIGKGANPERSGAVATGIVKNAIITLSIAAALGALSAGAVASGSAPLAVVVGAAAIVATEGLRKSRAFVALAALVSQGIDKASEGEIMKALADFREGFKPQLRFFLSIEANIKRLAGQRQEFKWLTKTLPWLEQQTGGKQRKISINPSRHPPLLAIPRSKFFIKTFPSRRETCIYRK